MKYSIYNSCINVSSRVLLLYNSFTDGFMFLNKVLSFDLEKPAIIKEIHLKLYRNMVRHGFYVENHINETDRLKQIANKVVMNDTSFFLMINPTINCNLNCWYCYEKHIDSCMSQDIYDRVTLLIKNITQKGIKHFTLGFFGGEPLMKYKKIVRPLINYTHDLCKKQDVEFNVTFTTNGTLLNKTSIDELCKYAKPSFQITLDGDKSEHDKIRFFKNKKGTYFIILQNIKKLLERGCHVTLRINYTKENIETIWNALKDFCLLYSCYREKLLIDFHRVWQDKEGNSVLPTVKLLADKLSQEGFNTRYHALNEIKNACYGDRKNTAVINYNGDVFKCTARDFIKENREGFLDEEGNIVWEKSQDYRLSLKLKNPLCHNCRIAPLCGSGCSRYILEKEDTGNPFCLFNQNDAEIDEFIVNHVESIIRNKKSEV